MRDIFVCSYMRTLRPPGYQRNLFPLKKAHCCVWGVWKTFITSLKYIIKLINRSKFNSRQFALSNQLENLTSIHLTKVDFFWGNGGILISVIVKAVLLRKKYFRNPVLTSNVTLFLHSNVYESTEMKNIQQIMGTIIQV
jgi:hypothetical protein